MKFSQYGDYVEFQKLDKYIHSFLTSVVVELTEENIEKLFYSDLKIIWAIDFYAQWCPPCLNFLPVFESLARVDLCLSFLIKIERAT